MRILALDVGDKTIGTAVSDELLLTAQGIGVIKRTSWERDINSLKSTIAEYQADVILVGFPKNMNGTIGPRGEAVQQFVQHLEQDIPGYRIILWDERLSTAGAERALIAADVRREKRRKIIDKMAAVFILQGYLDSLTNKLR